MTNADSDTELITAVKMFIKPVRGVKDPVVNTIKHFFLVTDDLVE
jgi:hypothetical protein